MNDRKTKADWLENCNDCRHLVGRVRHDKRAGITYGRCGNLHHAPTLYGDVELIGFAPTDWQGQPCFENRHG